LGKRSLGLKVQWVMVLVITLSQVAVAIGNQVVYPLTPQIKEYLHLSTNQIGYFTAASYGGGIGILWFSGWITDKIGVKKVLIAAQMLVGISIICAAFSGTFVSILIFLALAGVGYGTVTPAGTKAVQSWFLNEKNQATAMGLKQTGVPLGGIIAAYLLPVLTLWTGNWRQSLAISGILILSLSFVMYWYQENEQDDVPDSSVKTLELNKKTITRKVVILSLFAMVMGAAQFAVIGYLTLYLHETIGLDSVNAARFLGISLIGGVIGRMEWAVVSDFLFKNKQEKVLILLSLLSAGSFFSLNLFDYFKPGTLVLAAVSLVLGIINIGWNAVFLNAVAKEGGSSKAGSVVGFSMTICYIGIITGPILFGHIVEWNQNYTVAWNVQGAVSLLMGSILFFENYHSRLVSLIGVIWCQAPISDTNK